MIDRSQAGERFPRQTFSTGTTNSVRGQRQQTAKTTVRPRQSQRQSARQTAANPPLGPYRYGYAVTDENGLDFNQQETSDGGVVNGQYSVVLPDGRIQTVKYSVAPDTGYVVRILSVYDIRVQLNISSRQRSPSQEDLVGSSSRVKQGNDLRLGRTFVS